MCLGERVVELERAPGCSVRLRRRLRVRDSPVYGKQAVGVGETCIGARVVAIPLNRLAEVLDTPAQTFLGPHVPVITAPQIQIEGIRTLGGLATAWATGLFQPGLLLLRQLEI